MEADAVDLSITANGKTIHTNSRELKAAAQLATKHIDLGAVRHSMPELEDLCRNKLDAAEEFKVACKAVAEKARVDSAVLQAFVTAVVQDKLKEKQDKAEQLALLFDHVPG